MFNKKNRLNSEEVSEILNQVKGSNRSFYFSIKKRENSGNLDDFPTQFRVAVIVPKKIAKSAVKRHILKRKVFGILQEINLAAGTDYLIFVQKDFSKEFKQKRDKIKQELAKILE